MATFIQGVTDTNLDPVLFTPDYSFLRYALGKKTAQYEQGLKSVSASYAAMKKELTDPVNIELRENYLKSAESQLQQIAGSDLSIQQNVNAANAIFDPIATNPAIAFDGYYTAKNKRELSQMESWAQSEDPAERKKFNKQIYDWVKRDLEAIKNGKGDVKNYKVEGRSAWAFIDPQEIVEKAAKERGFKVMTDELGQPYIVTTEGGPTFAPNYKAFAQSIFESDPLYKQQASILSQAKVESIIQEKRATNPNLQTNEMALNAVVDNDWPKARASQESYINGLKSDLAVMQAENEAYIKANISKVNDVTSKEYKIANEKVAAYEQYKARIGNITSDFNKMYGATGAEGDKLKEQFRKQFLENPQAYYYKQIIADDITRFSNIRSSYGTRKITPDQAYIGMLNVADRMRNTFNNISDDQFDNKMNIEDLEYKYDALNYKYNNNDDDNDGGNSSSSSSSSSKNKKNKKSDIQSLGISSVDLKVENRFDKIKDYVSNTVESAMQSLDKGLNILTYLGVSEADASLTRTYFDGQYRNPKRVVPKQEWDALNRVYMALGAWSKQNPDANKEIIGVMNNQINSKTRYDKIDFPALLTMAAKNFQPTDERSKLALYELLEYQKKQNSVNYYSGILNNTINGTVAQIVKDPKKLATMNQVIVQNPDKSYRLIEPSDIEKQIPLKGWKEDNWGPFNSDVSISEKERKEIAQAIFNGTAKVSSTTIGDYGNIWNTEIKFNGRTISLQEIGLSPSIKIDSNGMKQGFKNFYTQIPEIKVDPDQEGRISATPMFEISGDTKDLFASILGEPTQTNSNIFIKTGDNQFVQVGSDDAPEGLSQTDIRREIKDPKNIVSMVVETSTTIPGGSQAIKVTFGPKKNENDASKVRDAEVYFPINVTGDAPPLLQYLAQAQDASEFMILSKQNKPYVMDHFESSGVKVEIHPYSVGSSKGTIKIFYKYDPNTQKFTDTWQQYGEPQDVDFSQNTFNEVKQSIYTNIISPFVSSKMQYNKMEQQKAQAAGGVPFSQSLLERNK